MRIELPAHFFCSKFRPPQAAFWHGFCCTINSWGLFSTQMHQHQIFDYREVDLSVSRLVDGF